jgi:hypothetical protein
MRRPLAAGGAGLHVAGVAGLAAWDEGLGEPLRSAPQISAGLGFGLVLAPLATAVLARVEEGDRATAAVWLTLARVGGMLVGTALLTSSGLGRSAHASSAPRAMAARALSRNGGGSLRSVALSGFGGSGGRRSGGA